mmetsp:Transcript_3064/g.13258  ORF Transcript_3064/g.13258 Transcript_3064/m.13258 type:complete len:289 (+) Transcript_3064:491-1357(+)
MATGSAAKDSAEERTAARRPGPVPKDAIPDPFVPVRGERRTRCPPPRRRAPSHAEAGGPAFVSHPRREVVVPVPIRLLVPVLLLLVRVLILVREVSPRPSQDPSRGAAPGVPRRDGPRPVRPRAAGLPRRRRRRRSVRARRRLRDRRPRRPRGWEACGPAPSDRSRRGSIVKVRRRRSGAPVRREGAGRCLAAARWPPAPIDPVRAGDDRPRRRGGCLRNRPAGRSVARGAPAPDEPCRSRPPSPRTFAARRPRTLAPNPGDGDSPPGTTRTLRGRNPRGRARSGSRT